MFSGVRDLLNAFSGVGYSFNAFNGYFGGPGIDLASVQKVGNTLGAFDGLLQSISRLSQFAARLFAFDANGNSRSVFAAAPDYPNHNFSGLFQRQSVGAGDPGRLRTLVADNQNIGLKPSIAQIGDGPLVTGPSMSRTQWENLVANYGSRAVGYGAAPGVATYGRGGVQYDSVREYFDKNRYPFSA
jgi:hypothetical protein